MERYICDNVFVPLRSAPSHKSEMLSQILFGEKYSIVEKISSWIKIETAFDNYTGWIDTDHNYLTPDNADDKGFVLNRPLVCFKNDKTIIVTIIVFLMNAIFNFYLKTDTFQHL